MAGGMAAIRRIRGVPAKRGRRVRFNPNADGQPPRPQLGTIVSTRGEYLRVRMDGETGRPWILHPTWHVEYLDDDGKVIWPKPAGGAA